MTAYAIVALISLAILTGSMLDTQHPKRAAVFAFLVALAWPLIALLVLRGAFAKWRCERVAREAYRKARGRMQA